MTQLTQPLPLTPEAFLSTGPSPGGTLGTHGLRRLPLLPAHGMQGLGVVMCLRTRLSASDHAVQVLALPLVGRVATDRCLDLSVLPFPSPATWAS